MAVMTERGVPRQRSSHVRALSYVKLSMSVCMGRMRWTMFQAMAHVTTTAQLLWCLDRVEA